MKFKPTRPRTARRPKDALPGGLDAAAGSAGSEVNLGCSAGQCHTGKVDNPAPLSRRTPQFRSWDRPGKKWRWNADGKLRMRKIRVETFDADVLDPYPGLSPDEARQAWASKKAAFSEKTKMKYGPILTLLAGMSAESRTQAAAVLLTSQPNMKVGGFVKIMNGMSATGC